MKSLAKRKRNNDDDDDDNLNRVLSKMDRPCQVSIEGKCLQSGIKLIFENQIETLLELIDKCDFVLGCVAWLTHKDILASLHKKPSNILIQKENFLKAKPRSNNKKNFTKKLRQGYKSIPCFTDLILDKLETLVSPLHKNIAVQDSAIRCVGFSTLGKNKSRPNMHHKFLVFGSLASDDWTVWTGSANLTENATKSLENSIIIPSKEASRHYIQEWVRVFSLSEPLDWSSRKPKST